MRRLLALATLVAAIAIVALLPGRRQERRLAPAPACSESSGCEEDARVAATAQSVPTVAPTPPPPDRTESQAVRPLPTAAADGAALRAEADRLIAAGQVEEGIAVFRKAVEAVPTAKNHGDLGRLLYRLTAFDEAALHLRAAAELDPGNADRWIALANVYYQKVNPGEAWKAERRAREAEPGLELGRDAEGMRVRKGESVPRDP